MLTDILIGGNNVDRRTETVFTVDMTETPGTEETKEERTEREFQELMAEIRAERCPVCGGLNPGDITHTRCM